jgi:DNA-binding IclR family transcriptional regulator
MNTVERVTGIIGYLAMSGDSRGVTQATKELGLSKGTLHRILSSLVRAGWVVQNSESKNYTLGTKLLEISSLIVSNLDLRKASVPYLEKLHSTINETPSLSMRAGLERIVIDQLPGHHEVLHLVVMGKRLPLWCGAPGKVILAHLREREIEMIMDNLRKQPEQSTYASGERVDTNTIQKELADIRKTGFFVTRAERVVGATAVAAPIFGRNQEVIGALSVSGPDARFNRDQARRNGPLISQMAREISLQLRAGFGHQIIEL